MILTVKDDCFTKQNSPFDLCETYIFTVRYKLTLHICITSTSLLKWLYINLLI